MAEPSFAAGLVGIVLDGRYRLDAVLGEGGMGAVFRATQLAMDRRVAVKLLKPHLSGDEVALRRFEREARGTFKVDSPHAVKVLDYGMTELKDYYIVLEYLDGRTVQRELEVDGAFEPRRVVHIALHVLDALAAAHRVGLVHRDLKPENILLMNAEGDPDFTKVLDFGVAKLMADAQSPALSNLALTQQGMVFGTPEFMSPEQACGLQLDVRSNLYSLAATMFAMLTGRGLYDVEKTIEWLTCHATMPAPHLGDVVPALGKYRQLDGFLQKCLAKHREQRPASAEDMARELARILPSLDPETAGRWPTEPATEPSKSRWKTMFATSSQYVSALPPSVSGELAAQAPATSSTSDDIRALRPTRRPLYYVLGGLTVAAIALYVAVPKTRSEMSHLGSASTAIREEMGDAALAREAAGDASAIATSTTDASITNSGSVAGSVDAGTAHVSGSGSGSATAQLEIVHRVPFAPKPVDPGGHVAAAEDAHRSGNRLRQLAEADLALRADPTNSRARYLLGDAQLASGDVERGCKTLRTLGKSSAAIERARMSGCP